MKKRILVLMFIGLVALIMTGCTTHSEKVKKEEEKQKEEKQKEEQIISCLESELGAYIVSEKTNITDISISEFLDERGDISYYKGARTDVDHMYAIVKTDDLEVVNRFDEYFLEKYDTHQAYYIYYMDQDIRVYIHSSDLIDIDNLEKCSYSENTHEVVEKIDSKTIDKLQKTSKIRVYLNDKKIGTIENPEAIDEVLNAVSMGEQYGDVFTCDGHAFDFKMYDEDGELIDTLYVWGEGKRLIPESIHHGGCGYYIIPKDGIDMRKIIESETDYIFFSFFAKSESCKQNILVYEDKKYNYYLNCLETSDMFIEFDLIGLRMDIKYALDNNYVTINQLLEYSTFFIKEEK